MASAKVELSSAKKREVEYELTAAVDPELEASVLIPFAKDSEYDLEPHLIDLVSSEVDRAGREMPQQELSGMVRGFLEVRREPSATRAEQRFLQQPAAEVQGVAGRSWSRGRFRSVVLVRARCDGLAERGRRFIRNFAGGAAMATLDNQIERAAPSATGS